MPAGGEATPSLWREPEHDQETAPSALEMHDVFKLYRSGTVDTVALRGLELEVRPREMIAVLGPSGCGKSTLLALAAALDRPSAGDVRTGTRSLLQLDELELARYRAREVALVFQSDNLWPVLSARENIATGLRLAGHEHPNALAQAALAQLGLSHRARHRAGALSGGEQQRVAIAAAYARQAPLVLADEPTGELDSGNEQLVLESLRQLRDECNSTVIVVTHSNRVADAVDRVIEMRDGRVLS